MRSPQVAAANGRRRDVPLAPNALTLNEMVTGPRAVGSGGWPQLAAVNPMPHSSESVERTADAKAARVEHVGVHHRGRHVGMTQQFLDRPNIVAGA
jgi:hypothetical protein